MIEQNNEHNNHNNNSNKHRSTSNLLVFVLIIILVTSTYSFIGWTIPDRFKLSLADLYPNRKKSNEIPENLSNVSRSNAYDFYRSSYSNGLVLTSFKTISTALNYSEAIFRSSFSPPILWVDACGDTRWNEAAEREMYVSLLNKQTIDAISNDRIIDECLSRHLFVIDQHHWGFFSRYHCFIEQFGQTLYSPWMTLVSYRRFRVSKADREDFLSEGILRYFEPISTCSKLVRHPRLQPIQKRLQGDKSNSMTVVKMQDLLHKTQPKAAAKYTYLESDHVWTFGYEHVPHRRSMLDFNRLPLAYNFPISYLSNHASEHIYHAPSLSSDYINSWRPRNRAPEEPSIHVPGSSYRLTWQDRVFTSFLRYMFVLFFHRLASRISHMTTLLTEHWSTYLADKNGQSLSTMGALFIRRGDKMPEDSFWKQHGRWRNISMYVKGLVNEEERQNRTFSLIFVMTDDVLVMKSIQDYANPESNGTDETYARKHLHGRQILYNVFAPQACFDPFIRIGFDQFLVTFEFIVQHAQFVVGHSDSNVGRYLEEVIYVRHQLNASIQSDSFVKNAPDSL